MPLNPSKAFWINDDIGSGVDTFGSHCRSFGRWLRRVAQGLQLGWAGSQMFVALFLGWQDPHCTFLPKPLFWYAPSTQQAPLLLATQKRKPLLPL